MKKLLGILLLGLALTFSSNGISGEMNVFKKKIKLPKDVTQGYKKNAWKFCCNYDPKTRLTPDYAFKIVNKSDGHPVRFGEQSIRFEVRRGDCGVSPGGYNDCKNRSERHELKAEENYLKGVTWHTFSLLLPKDFIIDGFDWNAMGQFHSDGDGKPAFNWNVEPDGYEVQRRTGCNLPKNKKKKCSTRNAENHYQTLIYRKDLLGKWYDHIFEVKWSNKQDGYLKHWINGKLIYHYQGSNLTPGENEGFQFGIYRGVTPSSPKKATHVAYYDEVRYAKKSCKKLKLEDLGYSCDELESQKISKIDTIEKDNFMAVIKSKDDEKYILKVSGPSKKLAGKKGIKKCKESGKTGCYVHYASEKTQY